MKIVPPYTAMDVVKGFRDQGSLLLEEPSPAYGSRYLDPLSDFHFKYIFGKEAHKDLLKDFLNSVYKGRKVIRDFHLSPTEHGGEKKETRKILADLLCTGNQRERFLIEMQRDRQDFFPTRAQFYGSRMVSELVPAGKKGDNFNLPDVYVLSIMDFNSGPIPTFLPTSWKNICVLMICGASELGNRTRERLNCGTSNCKNSPKQRRTCGPAWTNGCTC